MAVKPKVRFAVLRRDSFRCVYCGARAPGAVLHVDHVDPRASGGVDESWNLVTACEECNQGKGASRLSPGAVSNLQYENTHIAGCLSDWRELTGYDMPAELADRFRDLTRKFPPTATSNAVCIVGGYYMQDAARDVANFWRGLKECLQEEHDHGGWRPDPNDPEQVAMVPETTTN